MEALLCQLAAKRREGSHLAGMLDTFPTDSVALRIAFMPA